MTGNPASPISFVYQKLKGISVNIVVLFGCFFSTAASAQTNEQLTGHWQLQQVSFRKAIAGNAANDKATLLTVFETALNALHKQDSPTTAEDAGEARPEAEILRDRYYQSIIAFDANGAFHHTSPHKNKSLSGEYMLVKKKLMLEWETADKSNFRILKITATELVLKDTKLQVVYHYKKLQKKEVDEIAAILKYKKSLEDTKPDKKRIADQQAAEEKMRQVNN